ncbi:MAG TPA: hypothetical protein VK903_03175 [Propionicimonas sp.]|nr:hypothetical protein [Propionicimonas sp.]
MEQVTINTSVNVKGGPTVNVNTRLESDAYVVASLALIKQATGDVVIMPNPSTAALLVIQATKDTDQSPAKVEVTPAGSAAGKKLLVTGSLLVANADAIAGLAADGPQKLTVKNNEAVDVTVSILAAFNS